MAAKTSSKIRSNKYTFSLKFLSKQKNDSSPFARVTSLIETLISTYQVFNSKPDILIISLWRSCLSGLIVKTLRPKTEIILFLHFPKSVNFIDYFMHLLISKQLLQVWADSYTTLKIRGEELKLNKQINRKIISLVAYKLKPNLTNKFQPNFIFWGRIAHVKRIDLAIKLFHEISKDIKDSKFKIIGPDCGMLQNSLKLRDDLNLAKRIEFFSPMDINGIKKKAENCSFFLHLSLEEGLGMSVLESMQMGLIPIVTNVGELQNYCIDNKNSIIFKGIESTKDKIIKLCQNKEEMKLLRDNAIKSWEKSLTYKENLIYELNNLL